MGGEGPAGRGEPVCVGGVCGRGSAWDRGWGDNGVCL